MKRNATLVFLVKKEGDEIIEACLAMKKRGFGEGRWNGTGGKVNPDEAIEAAAARETLEEIEVEAAPLQKVAELDFTFPHNPKFDQVVHVYLCEEWRGEPAESEEMRPQWFRVDAIPYGEMWADDPLWLPQVLRGERLRGWFTFAPDESVAEHSVEPANNF